MWLSIVSGLLKVANAVASALQQHHDELNGAKAQKDADNDQTTKVLEAVAAPTAAGDADKLWAENKARFGTGTGPDK